MLIISEKAALYASAADLQKYIGLSGDIIRKYIREMEELKGRYPYAVGRDGKIIRVNLLAFIDYFVHRRDFLNKKPVKPFNAKEVRESLGAQLTFERREK